MVLLLLDDADQIINKKLRSGPRYLQNLSCPFYICPTTFKNKLMAKNKNRFFFPLLLAFTFLFTGFIACSKDNDDAPADVVYSISGNANGGQEAPTRVTTSAAGTLSGNYNATSNVLTYTISWTGLSAAPNNMHFHGPADPGVSAGVVTGITGFPASTTGTISSTATLSEAQEADLLNFKWYYNIHTPAHPGGEIRGQVLLMRQ